MRIIALVLMLVSGLIGFVVSYGFAYKQVVTGTLISSADTVQTGSAFTKDAR